MHYKSFFLIFAATQFTGLMAAPTTSGSSTAATGSKDNVELFREKMTTTSGYLVYYDSIGGNETEATGLERRKTTPKCTTNKGTPQPTCSTSETARTDDCYSLSNELAATGTEEIPVTGKNPPRSICHEGTSSTNQYCCITWPNVIGSSGNTKLTKGDFAILAQNSEYAFL